MLLASKLVTNSVRHSGSAVQGGLVTVAVTVGRVGVRVEVTDRSGGSTSVLVPAAFANGDAEVMASPLPSPPAPRRGDGSPCP